jgi:hypothetical protein
LLDRVLLNLLAQAFGAEERVPLPLLAGEKLQVETEPAADSLLKLLTGEVAVVGAEPDGRLCAPTSPPALLVSGAFNPLHEGHLGMAAAAARLTGRPAAFELSILNVDKPPLSGEEIRRRLHQLVWRAPVWLTRAPTFVEKAVRFPGAIFVVGADTAARIVAPRYYGGREDQMAQALAQLRAAGCRFLVAGRVDASGRCVRLSDLAMPAAHADLFQEIPEAEFRLDISSTQLRARQGAS